MAEFILKDQPEEVQEWFNTRPPWVQERIKEYPPDRYYLLNKTHVVRLYAYTETDINSCDECQVLVLQHNTPHLDLFGGDRVVFGILFDDLEPLPDDEIERMLYVIESMVSREEEENGTGQH